MFHPANPRQPTMVPITEQSHLTAEVWLTAWENHHSRFRGNPLVRNRQLTPGQCPNGPPLPRAATPRKPWESPGKALDRFPGNEDLGDFNYDSPCPGESPVSRESEGHHLLRERGTRTGGGSGASWTNVVYGACATSSKQLRPSWWSHLRFEDPRSLGTLPVVSDEKTAHNS